MTTVQQKLEAVESKMRRWHTRLTRASNALRKLEPQRRRLMAPPKPVLVSVPKPLAETLEVAQVAAAMELDIPPILQRSQADVDKMKAERLAKEAAAKKAMPLTGREALRAIRRKK